MDQDRIHAIEQRLRDLNAEKRALEAELAALVAANSVQEPDHLGTPAAKTRPTTFSEQVQLFISLFHCREDVYPLMWEHRSRGTLGYSPACDNEWVRGVCGKPPNGKVKCSDCPNRAFRPLNEEVAAAHLQGNATIGSYAIREDDSCIFLACDFDGEGWAKDALLYQSVAADLGVEVLIERSRSGAGAHAWIFFAEPVSARSARSLGTLILARCTDIDCRIGVRSFDRFFPSQDFLPKGGFGNLIALPLQREPGRLGNTVFVDRELKPVADQWSLLASVRRLTGAELRQVLIDHSPRRAGVQDSQMQADDAIVCRQKDLRNVLPPGFPITVCLGSQLTIPLRGLPASLVSNLRKTATFPNPVYYRLQRMRMATYPHPRLVFAGELRNDELDLPRGLVARACDILRKAGATVQVLDLRGCGNPLSVSFAGTLTSEQKVALAAVEKAEQGVLIAPPGSGKTIIACAAIADRAVSTLVLVHKQPLVDQWVAQAIALLGYNKDEVGLLTGTRKKLKGKVDVATLQTLARMEDLEMIVATYGQVIVDECHHVPAVSFEAVMKRCSTKYVLGLTSTPDRKDGLERLLYFQCGPVVSTMTGERAAGLTKRAEVSETGFRMPEVLGPNPPYHIVAELLATDPARNSLIACDIASSLDAVRFPLVIADRKSQLGALIELLTQKPQRVAAKVYSFDGGVSPKARRKLMAEMAEARREGHPCVLFSTASLIGEGVDLPELDTLVLASPLSFEGRLIQYAGRLHRTAEGKTDVVVLDYVDSHWAVSLSMYRNRLRAYRKMGYEVKEPECLLGFPAGLQQSLFS